MCVQTELQVKTKEKIWGVIEGPIRVEDPEEVEEEVYMNLCKVEIKGKIEHVEYYFQNMDEAYDMVKHFTSSINPIEVEHSD